MELTESLGITIGSVRIEEVSGRTITKSSALGSSKIWARVRSASFLLLMACVSVKLLLASDARCCESSASDALPLFTNASKRATCAESIEI